MSGEGAAVASAAGIGGILAGPLGAATGALEAGTGYTPEATAQNSPLSVDQAALKNFLGTQAGSQWSSVNPNSSFYTRSGSTFAYDPGKTSINFNSPSEQGFNYGTDVGAMMAAFNAWTASNNQTKTNWQSYANQVSAEEGGQGDNTITAGLAVGQRQSLLGALANPGQPASPSPGLGSMGTIK